jgi:hypothetical protein
MIQAFLYVIITALKKLNPFLQPTDATSATVATD